MRGRPGSTWWLLQHEFRLYWRGINKKVTGYVVLIIFLVLLHLIAIPIAFAMKLTSGLPESTAAMLLTGAACFLLLLMISRGLISAVQALYARGDMDLLLSSPLAPQAIIVTRAAFIAASLTTEFAVLIWPFADVFVLFGMYGWLKAYVLLPALGMLAASISLVLALFLFRLFGARRTRVIAQILSALLGVAFTIVVQTPNIMRQRSVHGNGFSAGQGFAAVPFAAFLPSADSAVWRPALAVMHGFSPTILLMVGSAAILVLTIGQLGTRFISASVASIGVSTGTGTRGKARPLRFSRRPQLTLIAKELRLIARDPWLLTQLLQQSVYILPMCFLFWRRGTGQLPFIWGLLIFVAGSTASTLSWLTVIAEDAPELVAMAPVSRTEIVRGKLAAALLPILPLSLLPMFFLWHTHLWFACSVAACACGSAVSIALLNVGDRPPGNRPDLRTRYKGNSVRALVEMLINAGWALVCVFMVWLSPWR